MNLIDELLTVPEREDGGRTAYDRFDYQTAWGLARAVHLHKSGKNWAIAFEFHDDVVELDDASAPTKAIFYQVKTKEKGTWTLPKVTSRRAAATPGEKKPSHAGKMFDNITRFGSSVHRLVFVSNQSLPKLADAHGEVPFQDAETKMLDKFVSDLSLEAPDFSEADHLGLFYFHYSSLNLAEYAATLLGNISILLHEEVSLDTNPMPFALYLNDQCRTRSKALSDLADFDQLKKSKFLVRSQMQQWLREAKDRHDHRPTWDSIGRHLGLSFVEEAQIEKEWQTYVGLCRHRNSAASIDFGDRVKRMVDPAMMSASFPMEGVTTVFGEVRKLVDEWRPGSPDAFVKAVILYEFKR